MRVLECLIYILKAHYYGLLMLAILPSLYLFTQYMFKGTVHPKMEILSSFTPPQVVPNGCGKKIYLVTKQFNDPIDFHSIIFFILWMHQLFGYPYPSKYFLFCSGEEINSYRFGTTWVWENDDRLLIFGWTIPLSN